MNVKSEEEWAERSPAFLKHKLKNREVTYVEPAARLKKHGFKGKRRFPLPISLLAERFPPRFFSLALQARN
jgi:hypothetical protein